ncbi:CHAT domain-containing protein [Aerosakkonema funiforme]|uniref:CHAT domain-containing protein n=1 Tax=Aerosakkonema funiforme TaxID=1246630 RepID=UPI0035B720A8
MKVSTIGNALLLTAILSASPAIALNPVPINKCNSYSSACRNTLISRLSSEQLNPFLRLIQSGTDDREAKNYDRAIQTFQAALQLAQQLNYADGQWSARYNMAQTYLESDNFPKALELHQQNLAFFLQRQEDFDDKTKAPYTLIYISDIYTAQKNYAKAIEALNQALAFIEKLDLLSSSDSKARVLQHLGMNYFLAGNIPAADTNLAASLAAYQNIRKQRVGEQLPQQVDYTYEIEVNRWRQQVLVAQNRFNEALELAEQNRARVFVGLLASRLNSSSGFPATDEAPNIQQIKQIAKAENATLVTYSVIYDFSPQGAFWAENYQKFRATKLLIWVIKPTGEVAFRRSNIVSGNASLQEIVRQARASIGARGIGISVTAARVVNNNRPNTGQTAELKQLYQLLIQPIANLLPTNQNDRIIFIPQDFLFLVPFPALQDSAGKYLIEKHTMLTSPSIQVLQLTRSQQQRIQQEAKGILIVGNPTMPSIRVNPNQPPQQLPSLPGAEKEAIAIAKMFGTQPLLGANATKATVLEYLSKARIVHLATHGLLDDIGGFFSSLALAPTDRDNGFLTAREIISLKLSAELVVLSACDTGRGQISGDGVVGLSRSLIGAGVPSVIVSLWSVPDAPTASLMTAFYQNIKSGSDKAQALRNAMLKTMKEYPNPINWAAFTLIGAANSSGTLQAVTGGVAVANNSNTNSTQAVVRYYTVFPVPDNVTDYRESPSLRVPGEVDIFFHSTLSFEQLIDFYRQAYRQRGLTENTGNTRLTKDSAQLVFFGSPNGKRIIIQASEDYLGRGFRSVSVRFE